MIGVGRRGRVIGIGRWRRPRCLAIGWRGCRSRSLAIGAGCPLILHRRARGLHRHRAWGRAIAVCRTTGILPWRHARRGALIRGRGAATGAAPAQRGGARDRRAVGAHAMDRRGLPMRRHVRCHVARVAGGLLHALLLRRGRRDVRRLRCAQFLRRGLGMHPAGPTGIAGARAIVVDHGGLLVIDVGHARVRHVDDGAVIGKVPTFPTAALPAVAMIAKAIVDPAVPADFAAPVTTVKAKCAIVPAPPGRGPQQAGFGRQFPISRRPEIIVDVIAPCPMSGHPDIVGAGQGRLLINRHRRRRIADADVQPERKLGLRRCRHHHRQGGCGKRQRGDCACGQVSG